MQVTVSPKFADEQVGACKPESLGEPLLWEAFWVHGKSCASQTDSACSDICGCVDGERQPLKGMRTSITCLSIHIHCGKTLTSTSVSRQKRVRFWLAFSTDKYAWVECCKGRHCLCKQSIPACRLLQHKICTLSLSFLCMLYYAGLRDCGIWESTGGCRCHQQAAQFRGIPLSRLLSKSPSQRCYKATWCLSAWCGQFSRYFQHMLHHLSTDLWWKIMTKGLVYHRSCQMYAPIGQQSGSASNSQKLAIPAMNWGKQHMVVEGRINM